MPDKQSKNSQILPQIKALSLEEKLMLFAGCLGGLLYFIPGLQELGLYKMFIIALTLSSICYFSYIVIRGLLAGIKFSVLEAASLVTLLLIFILWSSHNLHLEKGLHIDEIWRLDRGRQFIVFNDFDYGFFRGYPLNKTLVGLTSLIGILEPLINTESFMRIVLGVIPSAAIIFITYLILKRLFSTSWAWIGSTILGLSFNFLDYSRSFLTEPLLGYLISLFFGAVLLEFSRDKRLEKVEFDYFKNLLPAFVLIWVTKYTSIVLIPVLLLALIWAKNNVIKLKSIKLIGFLPSILLLFAFIPYLFTFDGFVALVKGPARGFLPFVTGEFQEFRLPSIDPYREILPILIALGLVAISMIAGIIISLVRFLKERESKFQKILQNKNLHILAFIVLAAGFFVLGLIENTPSAAFFQHINLIKTDPLLFVLSTASILLLLTENFFEDKSKIGKDSNFKFMVFIGISSVVVLVTTSYFSSKITDSFARHIFPYLFILVTLSVSLLQDFTSKFKLNRRQTPLFEGFIVSVLIAISLAQLYLLSDHTSPSGSWEYEYFEASDNKIVSVKEFVGEFKSKYGKCKSFIYDDGQPFWSRYRLGPIAYYYGYDECAKDLSSTPVLKRLKTLDFYLRSNRKEQLEKPNSLGLYDHLIPLQTSDEIENILSDRQIVSEYILNTNAEFLITKRDLLNSGLTEFVVGDADLDKEYLVILVGHLEPDFDVFRIARQRKEYSIPTQDEKDYLHSRKQIQIETFRPTPNTPRKDYPRLFDYILWVGKNELEYSDERIETGEHLKLYQLDR